MTEKITGFGGIEMRTNVSKADADLYKMASTIRQVFREYQHVDVNHRICYALVIARTLAAEVGDERMVKAVEEVQSIIATEIYEEFIPALERVLADVRKEKNE